MGDGTATRQSGGGGIGVDDFSPSDHITFLALRTLSPGQHALVQTGDSMDKIVAHVCHTTKKATQDGLICKGGNLLNGSGGEWVGKRAGIDHGQARSRYEERASKANRAQRYLG